MKVPQYHVERVSLLELQGFAHEPGEARLDVTGADSAPRLRRGRRLVAVGLAGVRIMTPPNCQRPGCDQPVKWDDDDQAWRTYCSPRCCAIVHQVEGTKAAAAKKRQRFYDTRLRGCTLAQAYLKGYNVGYQRGLKKRRMGTAA
jgi:hypothetical protein